VLEGATGSSTLVRHPDGNLEREVRRQDGISRIYRTSPEGWLQVDSLQEGRAGVRRTYFPDGQVIHRILPPSTPDGQENGEQLTGLIAELEGFQAILGEGRHQLMTDDGQGNRIIVERRRRQVMMRKVELDGTPRRICEILYTVDDAGRPHTRVECAWLVDEHEQCTRVFNSVLVVEADGRVSARTFTPQHCPAPAEALLRFRRARVEMARSLRGLPAAMRAVILPVEVAIQTLAGKLRRQGNLLNTESLLAWALADMGEDSRIPIHLTELAWEYLRSEDELQRSLDLEGGLVVNQAEFARYRARESILARSLGLIWDRLASLP